MKKMFLNVIMPIRQKVININGRRSQTNKYQNLNLLFLHRHDQSERYRIRVVKNR